MRIGIDARIMLDQLTGAGRYLYNLLRELGEIDSKNQYTVFVKSNLAVDHPIHHLSRENFRFKVVPAKIATVSQQISMPFRLVGQRLNLYHYPFIDIPILQPFKSIVTVYDLNPFIDEHYFKKNSTIKRFLGGVMTYMSLIRAMKIVTISNSTKNDISSYFRIPEKKIHVTYLGVDSSYRPLSDKKKIEDYRLKLGVNKEFLLYVGNSRPHKNVFRLIEAFILAKCKYKLDVDLVLSGPITACSASLIEFLKNEPMAHSVHFTGYIQEEEMPLLYCSAMALLFPSLYEGFGLPVLEAFACGLPVITSNTSSMAEIANGTALLVNPFDVQEMAYAIKNVVCTKELRLTLQESGLKRAKDFSWKKMAEQTLDIYSDC
jgi:glycosyltransferase involved in cell wall biosynthesis